MQTVTALKFKPLTPARQASGELAKWSLAFESIAATNIRFAFAWQRIIMRSVLGL